MAVIERDNLSLKDVLPRTTLIPVLTINKEQLSQLINLVSDIALDDQDKIRGDALGRIYDASGGSGKRAVRTSSLGLGQPSR